MHIQSCISALALAAALASVAPAAHAQLSLGVDLDAGSGDGLLGLDRRPPHTEGAPRDTLRGWETRIVCQHQPHEGLEAGLAHEGAARRRAVSW